MDENTFSKLLTGKLFKEDLPLKPRLTKRVSLGVEAIIASNNQTLVANVIDCSSTVLRIDKEISIAHQGPCIVILKLAKPIEVVCFPIIGDKEFRDGFWNRLRIKTPLQISF